MKPQETSIIFRIDRDIKIAFEQIAKEQDLTTSQMLRAYIRAEVAEKLAETTAKPSEPEKRPTPPRKPKKATSAAASMLKQMKKGVF